MKNLHLSKNLIVVIISALCLCGCSNGPNENIVKNDITKYFKEISKGYDKYEVMDIDIVGRKSFNDNVIVQCKVKTKNTYLPMSGGQQVNDVNFNVSFSYAKFGDEWKLSNVSTDRTEN